MRTLIIATCVFFSPEELLKSKYRRFQVLSGEALVCLRKQTLERSVCRSRLSFLSCSEERRINWGNEFPVFGESHTSGSAADGAKVRDLWVMSVYCRTNLKNRVENWRIQSQTVKTVEKKSAQELWFPSVAFDTSLKCSHTTETWQTHTQIHISLRKRFLFYRFCVEQYIRWGVKRTCIHTDEWWSTRWALISYRPARLGTAGSASELRFLNCTQVVQILML